MLNETIGARIKRLRYSFTPRLTQAVLAKHCGISRAAVNQWEVDRTTPSGQSLLSVAKLLGVTPDYLLYGKEHCHEVPKLNEAALIQAVRDALNYMASVNTSFEDKPDKFAEIISMQYQIRNRTIADV